MTQRVDGREAYLDEPGYTAPEMQPGKGEDLPPETPLEGPIAIATGLTIGTAAGALAGEMLVEEAEAEHEALTPRRDV